VAADRLARWLHPGAWWAWALGLAAAASRTTNPLVLLLIIAAAAIVVAARKPAAPWARSFSFFVRLGVLVIIVRVLVQVVFSASVGTTVLLDLPGVALPSFLAGVRLGGEVTLESLLVAFYDGLRLATILIAVGSANSLASPTRLLKSVPAALYELGVSVVVALTFTPQLMADVDRLRTTRRLRGRPTSGPRAIAGAAVPVLEGALERSVTLAAAMDSRGYGRRGAIPVSTRRLTWSRMRRQPSDCRCWRSASRRRSPPSPSPDVRRFALGIARTHGVHRSGSWLAQAWQPRPSSPARPGSAYLASMRPPTRPAGPPYRSLGCWPPPWPPRRPSPRPRCLSAPAHRLPTAAASRSRSDDPLRGRHHHLPRREFAGASRHRPDHP
jgi:energy-coupling factor transporter transmembrane protein EcfT